MGKRLGTFNVQEIATAAAIEALKLQKNEERMRVRRNRFHNTELLLKNYLGLMEHYQNAVDSFSETHEGAELFNLENVDMDDIIIQSIRRSKIRTKVMINQIDTCMELLRVKINAKGQPERYEVIHKLYLEPSKSSMQWTERIQVVAAEIPCGEASVRRWKNDMINELSILLFGVDGLQLEL